MIFIRIQSVEKTLFEGDYDSLTSVNEQGPFDILPMHSNFISLIREKIELKKNGKTETIAINTGVLKATDNKINIFLEI